MRPLETRIHLGDSIPYTGSELRPHFLRTRFGIEGDGAALFRGPCHVDAELVDLEDREANAFIHSEDMLHVLVECFQIDLRTMVLLQRILAGLVADVLRIRLPESMHAAVQRQGDDIYVGEGKLTVSIATVSLVSGLIHLGINVKTDNTPVPTAGLEPLQIPVDDFARDLMAALADEVRGVIHACCKVRPVWGADGGPKASS